MLVLRGVGWRLGWGLRGFVGIVLGIGSEEF